jgi:hypothetical protein
MPSYTYRRAPSESCSLRGPTKSPADSVRSDPRSRKTAAHASEVDDAMSTTPTLDDFGGRSDALGG